MLKTISPLDNRYLTQSQELSNYFSEFAFCKYRIRVEISWFQNFYKKVEKISPSDWVNLKNIVFNEIEFSRFKEIEKNTLHELKLEYYILEKIKYHTAGTRAIMMSTTLLTLKL